MLPATPCSPSSRTGSSRCCAPATPPPGSAATSSRCSARTPSPTTPSSPDGCAPPRRTRSSSTARDHPLGGGRQLRDGALGPRRRAPRGRPADVRGKAPATPPRSPQPAAVVTAWICATCAVQYPDTDAAARRTARSARTSGSTSAGAASGGPPWPSSAADHAHRLREEEPGLLGIGVTPVVRDRPARAARAHARTATCCGTASRCSTSRAPPDDRRARRHRARSACRTRTSTPRTSTFADAFDAPRVPPARRRAVGPAAARRASSCSTTRSSRCPA